MANMVSFAMLGFCLLSLTILPVLSYEHESLLEKWGNEKLRAIRNSCANIANGDRMDCGPGDIDQLRCHQRGCCWMEPNHEDSSSTTHYDLNTPYCYFSNEYTGYTVMHKDVKPFETILTLQRVIPSGFLDDVPDVRVIITSVNDHQMRIRVVSSSERRYEVPLSLNMSSQSLHNPLFKYKLNRAELSIYRAETDQELWRADFNSMVYSDLFIQLNTRVFTDAVYGLGEHKESFRKDLNSWKAFSFWNVDKPPLRHSPLYGTHPMYVVVEKNSTTSKVHAHSVFLLNSNAIEVILRPKRVIVWRTLGGILDFFVNLGPTIEDTVKQHVNLVGLPQLPPYWSLGFHLSRYGYDSLENTRAVYDRMRKNKVPYDVQWHDIDFMDQKNVFTYDKEKFDGLPGFVDELHKNGMKYIPMFDPGLGGGHTEEEYPSFYEGLRADVYMKNASGQVLRGIVWNMYWTAWVDFTHPNSKNFWVQQFHKFHKQVPFDGAWIDMNEPASLDGGSIDGCPPSRLNNPQYVPHAIGDLTFHTACMDGRFHLGTHYDLHNIYGYFEAIATDAALRSLGKRPFVLSRATFAGQGKYSNHWTGDVFSSWDDLKISISNMIEFNIFGIPMVGADICGFVGDTTEELCARWQTLGSFYPFSRNHNALGTREQDPPFMGETVLNATIKSLNMRYSLLPLLYTELYKSTLDGRPVIRSLFFEFTHEPATETIENQFLWGHALMVAAIVDENVYETNVYYPGGRWYKYTTGELVSDSPDGKYIMRQIPLTDIEVVVRGGHILATQKPEITTTLTRLNPFRLLVALDQFNQSSGDLFWDDGESIDTPMIGEFNYVKFDYKNNVLTTTPDFVGYNEQPLVESIQILGQESPATVLVNNVTVSQVHYDRQIQSLVISGLSLNLTESNTVKILPIV